LRSLYEKKVLLIFLYFLLSLPLSIGYPEEKEIHGWVYLGTATFSDGKVDLYYKNITWVSNDIVDAWLLEIPHKESKKRKEHIKSLIKELNVPKEKAENFWGILSQNRFDLKNKRGRILYFMAFDNKGKPLFPPPPAKILLNTPWDEIIPNTSGYFLLQEIEKIKRK
jgi:hypothetical protein